ncbi:MAG: eukaryotic-like serine/threonine-protein kinase [Blastocatellia bacterium]|nr:eukaryotic-like serine/threonine-protein kinase [Blastocatellia bacterium]
MTIAAGTKLGRYEIRSKIGEGGMGEVYLGQDTKLDRKVALKILPADVASNHDRMERFTREAKSAAALNHPNIAHMYEIGESEGTHFIAMEFVEGVTLREKIHRERTELRKLLRYLQHVAEGLAKAHAAGIVHRDLKPDNVMITREGHAKILDFGLAKLIEPQLTDAGAGDNPGDAATAIMQQQSTPGVIMGTVGYMSPEQAQGKTKEIDQRSDIFSFGCILFEAATGKKPFEGESIVKSLHSLIYEPTPQIKDLNPSAPAELQRIVRRCLEKDADDRYQSIREVAIELKHLRRELEASADFDTTVPPPTRTATVPNTDSGSTINSTAAVSASIPSTLSSAQYVVQGIKHHRLVVAIALLVLISAVVLTVYSLRAGKSEVAIHSIAVLPFQNKSSDADTEYLSDGLAESLIYRLSQLPNLKVSPTSSVIRYKGKDTEIAQIARELEVDAVMSGRVSQRGNDLTISVELVDARTKKIIWAEQYDRKMSDLLATQREIATAIAQKLELKLSGKGFKGHLEFHDLGLAGSTDDLKFRSTSINSKYALDNHHGTFMGTGTLNGVSGYTFIMTIEDNAKKGAGNDKFRIQIMNSANNLVYDSNTRAANSDGTLIAGKIKIHYDKDDFNTSSLEGNRSFLAGSLNFDIDVETDGLGGYNSGAGVQFTDSANTFTLTSVSIDTMKLGGIVTVTGPALYNGVQGYKFQTDWDTGKLTLHLRIFDSAGKQIYDSKPNQLTSGSCAFNASN